MLDSRHANTRRLAQSRTANKYTKPRRDKLRRAIEQEQFEAAAELRDRIRVLE